MPETGGETTTIARNTDSDNSLQSVRSNEAERSGAGLSSQGRKGRLHGYNLRENKGLSQGQFKNGNRFAALAADDLSDMDIEADLGLRSPDLECSATGRKKRSPPSTFVSGRVGSDSETEGLALTKISTSRRGRSRGVKAGPSRENFLKPAPVRSDDISTDRRRH